MPADNANAPTPALLLFDVNETLLDLAPLKTAAAAALGDHAELLPLWFTSLLHHSLVTSAAGRFHGFDEIAAATLLMLARGRGLALDEDQARAVAATLRRLPPHPDVEPALRRLRSAGITMAALTNSTRGGVAEQMEYAGLSGYFDALLSVEDVGTYKPHGEVYRWAARRMGAGEGASMMVAAHGWDVAGALWAGLRAAFVARPGQVLFPLAPAPEIVEPDLGGVARRLLVGGAPPPG